MLSTVRTTPVLLGAILLVGGSLPLQASPQDATNQAAKPDSASKSSATKTKKASGTTGAHAASASQKPVAAKDGRAAAPAAQPGDKTSSSRTPASMEGDKLSEERMSTRGLHPPDEKPAKKEVKKDTKKAGTPQ